MTAAGTPEAPRVSPWLVRSFGFAVTAFVWWRMSENTADNDLWGHVLYGQRMLQLGGLETTETLSWTAAGLPWINHEVLAEIALGLTHRLAGGTGLWALMMALAGVTLGWAWHAGAGRDRGRRITALALLALSTNCIALGYAVRPQLFTYLCFVALLVALRNFFAGRMAWGVAIPVLLLAWTNTHGGFLAGWVIVLVAVGAELVAPRLPALQHKLHCEPVQVGAPALGALAATATLALLGNPWGWKLVVWTFETLRLPRPHLFEWQPMPFTAGSLPFFFVILLGMLAWGVSRQPRRLWELVTWSLLAARAIRAQRHAPLFGLASLVFLPAHLQDLLARLSPHATSLRDLIRRPAVALAATLALFVAGGKCLHASTAGRAYPCRMEVPRTFFPVGAIEYMKTHRLAGNTVTFFDWGQQVLWELPDNPVSFDGRLDTVYPPAIMDAHWALYAGRDPGPGLDLAKAEVALLPTGGDGYPWLKRHGWKVAYCDALATVLTRTPVVERPGFGSAEDVTGSVPFPDAIPVLATRAAKAR
jgi:hypothetical protein